MAEDDFSLVFEASYDDEAQVWVAHSDHARMTTEAPSRDELLRRLASIVPDVISERSGWVPDGLKLIVNWREMRISTGRNSWSPDLVADYARELRRLLREAGCFLVRQGKGDHEIWYRPITKTTVPVDSKILSRHSANGVLKDAGLPKAF